MDERAPVRAIKTGKRKYETDPYRLNIIVIRSGVIALRFVLIIRVDHNYGSRNIFFGIIVILKARWVCCVKLILHFDCVFRFKFYAGLMFFVILFFGCIFRLKFYVCCIFFFYMLISWFRLDFFLDIIKPSMHYDLKGVMIPYKQLMESY